MNWFDVFFFNFVVSVIISIWLWYGRGSSEEIVGLSGFGFVICLVFLVAASANYIVQREEVFNKIYKSVYQNLTTKFTEII